MTYNIGRNIGVLVLPSLTHISESQNEGGSPLLYTAIAREVVGKMCTRQYRKVIWDMIKQTVPDFVALEPAFVAFL